MGRTPPTRHPTSSSKSMAYSALIMGQCPVGNISAHKWHTDTAYSSRTKHSINSIKWINDIKPDLILSSDSPISTASCLMSYSLGLSANKEGALQEIKSGLFKPMQNPRKPAFNLFILNRHQGTCSFLKINNLTHCQSSTSFEPDLS